MFARFEQLLVEVGDTHHFRQGVIETRVDKFHAAVDEVKQKQMDHTFRIGTGEHAYLHGRP
eukprot:2570338-Karenia_brevis.AAC.1